MTKMELIKELEKYPDDAEVTMVINNWLFEINAGVSYGGVYKTDEKYIKLRCVSEIRFQ